jgi:hypothetical protein
LTDTSNIVDNNFNTVSGYGEAHGGTDDVYYVQIDLGGVYNLSSLKVKRQSGSYANPEPYYCTVKVSDGSSWITLSANPLVGDQTQNETFTSSISHVRYIRSTLYSSNSYLYTEARWYEIQAFARELILFTPVNNSYTYFNFPDLTHDIYFSWENTSDNYNIKIAKDQDFNILTTDKTLSVNYTTESLEPAIYWWKVRVYDSLLGTYGNYSNVSKFNLVRNASGGLNTGIEGFVYRLVDGTQVPLSDAIVYIHTEALNWSSNQITGTNGYYLFDNLTNNTVYSISAKATGYEDSMTEYVTTITGQRVTKNILLTKCISGFNCGFYTQPVTFTLRNLFDASFSGVTATVYKGDELTSTDIGITDSSGSVTFMLNKDQKYRVVFSGGGIETLTFYAFGSSTNYRILVVSGFPTGGNRNEDISANLAVTSLNATHSNLSLVYKDNRSSTTAISFYATNLTTNSTCTQTSTSQDIALNCTVSSTGTYRFGFTATSSIYGTFQQDKIINFGTGTQTNNPLAGKVDSTLLQWGCIMLLVFVAAMFSVQTVKFGAVIVPAMAMVFWSLGWMQVNFILVATAMCIGVMVYLRMSEHKVEY